MIEYFIYDVLRVEPLPARYSTFNEARDALMARPKRDGYVVDCVDKMGSKSEDRREALQNTLFGGKE